MESSINIEQQIFQNSIEQVCLQLSTIYAFATGFDLSGDLANVRQSGDVARFAIGQLRGYLDGVRFVFVSGCFNKRLTGINDCLYRLDMAEPDVLKRLFDSVSLYRSI